MTEADFMLPQDKANHMVYGASVFLFFFVLTRSPGWSMFGAAAVGAAKEGSDWLLNWREKKAGLAPTHDPSPYDFAATCAGGLLPYLAVLAS